MKLVQVLNDQPAETVINLMDGAFDIIAGWNINDGSTLLGRGPSFVTLRYILGNEPRAVVANLPNGLGGITVQGMTIDEGWLPGCPVAFRTFAVALFGNNCTIRDVVARNGYGNKAADLEAFTFGIFPNGNGKDMTGGLIEACLIFDFRGDYGIGYGLLPSPDGTGSVAGFVRNCPAIGYKGTAAFGVASHVTFDNCTADGCSVGFYTEGCVDAVIANSKVVNPDGFSIHLTTVNGLAKTSHVVIENCDIEADHIAIALSGGAPGRMTNITVRGNRITGTGDAVNAEFVGGLMVEDNEVAQVMESHLTNCPARVVRGNKLNGTPVGLEDSP